MRSLFVHELLTHRLTILGWGLGIAMFGGMYTLFYPSMPAEMLTLDLSGIAIYQAMGNISISSFESYLSSAIFNFMTLIVAIYAVSAGTETLAGEEDAGTLELLATLPLSRWQLVLAKAMALAVALAIILGLAGSILALIVLALGAQLVTAVSSADLLRMALGNWPILMVFTMLSMLLGALLPNRRMASVGAAVAVIGSYFGNNLLAIHPDFDGLIVSPFYYCDGSQA